MFAITVNSILLVSIKEAERLAEKLVIVSPKEKMRILSTVLYVADLYGCITAYSTYANKQCNR